MGACSDCLLYFVCNDQHTPSSYEDDEENCFVDLNESENEYINSDTVWMEFSYRRYLLNPWNLLDELSFDEEEWLEFETNPNYYKDDYYREY